MCKAFHKSVPKKYHIPQSISVPSSLHTFSAAAASAGPALMLHLVTLLFNRWVFSWHIFISVLEEKRRIRTNLKMWNVQLTYRIMSLLYHFKCDVFIISSAWICKCSALFLPCTSLQRQIREKEGDWSMIYILMICLQCVSCRYIKCESAFVWLLHN